MTSSYFIFVYALHWFSGLICIAASQGSAQITFVIIRISMNWLYRYLGERVVGMVVCDLLVF